MSSSYLKKGAALGTAVAVGAVAGYYAPKLAASAKEWWDGRKGSKKPEAEKTAED